MADNTTRSGTSASGSNPFSVPRQVRIANKYVVMEKIGSGAFGDIYSGKHWYCLSLLICPW